jgi:hypothetical protein
MTGGDWAKLILWPDVSIRRKAQYAIDEGFWAATIIAAVAAIAAGYVIAGEPDPTLSLNVYAGAAAFVAIAVGIRLRSRAAAITGLILFIANRIYSCVTFGPNFIWQSLFLAVGLLQGVRGTIGYYKLGPKPVGMPSIEDSFRAVKEGAEKGQQPHP